MNITHIADWITIIGLPISIFSIILAYIQTSKAKSAAQAAEETSKDTSDKIKTFQSMANLSQTIERLKICDYLNPENSRVDFTSRLEEARDHLLRLLTSYEENSDEWIKRKKLNDKLCLDIRNLKGSYTKEKLDLDLIEIYSHLDECRQIFISEQTKLQNNI